VPVDWPGWSTDPGRFIGRPRPGTATRCDTTPPGSAGLCSGAMSILIRPSQLRIGEITSVRDGPQRARLHAERGPHSLSVMLAPGVISSACRAIDIPPAMPAATRAPPYRRQRVLRQWPQWTEGPAAIRVRPAPSHVTDTLRGPSATRDIRSRRSIDTCRRALHDSFQKPRPMSQAEGSVVGQSPPSYTVSGSRPMVHTAFAGSPHPSPGAGVLVPTSRQ